MNARIALLRASSESADIGGVVRVMRAHVPSAGVQKRGLEVLVELMPQPNTMHVPTAEVTAGMEAGALQAAVSAMHKRTPHGVTAGWLHGVHAHGHCASCGGGRLGRH